MIDNILPKGGLPDPIDDPDATIAKKKAAIASTVFTFGEQLRAVTMDCLGDCLSSGNDVVIRTVQTPAGRPAAVVLLIGETAVDFTLQHIRKFSKSIPKRKTK